MIVPWRGHSQAFAHGGRGGGRGRRAARRADRPGPPARVRRAVAVGARPRRRPRVGARGLSARLGIAGAVLDRARRAGVADLDAPDRQGMQERSRARKSDPIDAVNVARVALQEGLDAFPAAHLDGPELDVRLLVDHRERLVRHRVELNSTLLWHLHDLWPELRLPGGALFSKKWSTRIGRRLARAQQTMRVRIARDELRRLRELTQAINQLEREIGELLGEITPQLLAEPGFRPLIAAKLVGAQRFATPAKGPRAAGVAP